VKYLLTGLLGAVLGAIGAGAVLYFNPLTAAEPNVSDAGAWSLDYSFPDGSVLALTHSGRLSLPATPAEVPALWETTIEDVALSVVALTDSAGDIGAVASRISVPSAETDLLLRGVIVSELWLASVPGQGTFAITGDNNLWPLVKDTYLPVSLLRREWRGPAEYAITVGPLRGAAQVRGVSGVFAGRNGSAEETYSMQAFSAEHGIEAMRGALAVTFDAVVPANE
jgi:hypothetical protein